MGEKTSLSSHSLDDTHISEMPTEHVCMDGIDKKVFENHA